MNVFIKATFLLLAASASAAEPELNAETFREELANGNLVKVNGNKDGASYCDWSPDYDCYKGGWPRCCEGSNPTCPRQRPDCDKEPDKPSGATYCVWSPDYGCYKQGWPRCCLNPNTDCPKQQPACETNPTRRPTNRNTPRPTRRPTRRPHRSPTRRPTRRPTNRNTRRPTRRPTGNRPTSSCVDDERPRPVRNGQRYRFNLFEGESNAECVDQQDNTYEWGLFEDIDTFSDCAEACVNDAPKDLATSSNFRGFDFDCNERNCKCLYDEASISTNDAKSFARSNRNDRSVKGEGSIEGSIRRDGFYCGKLVGAEMVLEGLEGEGKALEE